MKYFYATAAYGVLRSFPRLYERQESYYDIQSNRTQTRPMLLTEKIARAFAVGAAAPVLWPFFLFTDIKLAEILLMNKDPKQYGFDKNWDSEPKI